jgi:hypothetical protein
VKKLPLLIKLGIVIAVVGYFLYDNLAKKKGLSPWDLVPSETIMVYESGPCETCQDELKNSSILNIVREAVFSADQDSQRITICFVSGGRPHLTTRNQEDDFDFDLHAPAKPSQRLSSIPYWKNK